MTAPTRPTRLVAAVLASLAAVSLVACGDDDESSDTTVAATSADAVVIEVDADSGTPGTQTVALGTSVSFHIVTATEQEFHLHDYDIEQAGTDVTMTFVADQAGTFELESHDTEELLFTLVVE
jgi:hypothetical protein